MWFSRKQSDSVATLDTLRAVAVGFRNLRHLTGSRSTIEAIEAIKGIGYDTANKATWKAVRQLNEPWRRLLDVADHAGPCAEWVVASLQSACMGSFGTSSRATCIDLDGGELRLYYVFKLAKTRGGNVGSVAAQLALGGLTPSPRFREFLTSDIVEAYIDWIDEHRAVCAECDARTKRACEEVEDDWGYATLL